MTAYNRLDKLFGPFGSFAGVIILIAGIISLRFSVTGIVLIFWGAFMGFTTTSTRVDFEKRRIMFATNLFGFIRSGNWVTVSPGMRFGVARLKNKWKTSSMGNRTSVAETEDFRIILYDSAGRKIMDVVKFNIYDAAVNETVKLTAQLGLTPD